MSAFFAAISFYSSTFWLLIFARALSGFGEASLQCAIPPWIQDVAPLSQRGMWMSIFYTAIPVGIAIGYAYSSFMATSIGWSWSFILEAIVACPFALYFAIISWHNIRSTTDHRIIEMVDYSHEKATQIEQTDSDDDVNPEYGSPVTSDSPSFLQELKTVLNNACYSSIVMGYAAQTATLMGISTFGSSFMMGLGIFETESESSMIFGVLISIAGVIGTPLGGFVLDKMQSTDHESNLLTRAPNNVITTNSHLAKIGELIYWSSLIGTILLCLLYFITSRGLYLAIVTIGCSCLFATTSAISLGIMLSVPIDSRSFAVGLSTVIIHLFGDVPSPVITGYLKDLLAPGCSAVKDGEASLAATSNACKADRDGLRMTMFMVFAWCYLSVIFFWFMWRTALLKLNKS